MATSKFNRTVSGCLAPSVATIPADDRIVKALAVGGGDGMSTFPATFQMTLADDGLGPTMPVGTIVRFSRDRRAVEGRFVLTAGNLVARYKKDTPVFAVVTGFDCPPEDRDGEDPFKPAYNPQPVSNRHNHG